MTSRAADFLRGWGLGLLASILMALALVAFLGISGWGVVSERFMRIDDGNAFSP
jgi:hypothetical protein